MHAHMQYNEGMRGRLKEKGQVNVAIRLDPQKHRRLRQYVVKQGTSIQRVVENLIDRWIDECEHGAGAPPDLRGFLRDTDILELHGRERQAEIERDRSRL
jgi:ParG